MTPDGQVLRGHEEIHVKTGKLSPNGVETSQCSGLQMLPATQGTKGLSDLHNHKPLFTGSYPRTASAQAVPRAGTTRTESQPSAPTLLLPPLHSQHCGSAPLFTRLGKRSPLPTAFGESDKGLRPCENVLMFSMRCHSTRAKSRSPDFQKHIY